jgi:uncharacterized protein YqkB
MQLTITPKATQEIKEIKQSNHQYLLLFYDIEGCGCGVNGVITLRLTETKGDTHVTIMNEAFKVIVAKQQMIFLEKKMKLDYVNHAFRLSSPQGILNPIISQAELLKEGSHD